MPFKKKLFLNCGYNVIIGKGGQFTYTNIIIGNNVYINNGAMFMCTKAKIILNNNIMI